MSVTAIVVCIGCIAVSSRRAHSGCAEANCKRRSVTCMTIGCSELNSATTGLLNGFRYYNQTNMSTMEEPPQPTSTETKKPAPTNKPRRSRDPSLTSAATSAQHAREKQKRIAACDVCRLRKVKCVKNPAGSGNDAAAADGSEEKGKQTAGSGGERCIGCTELNRECTYEYLPKRPGPPNP